MKIRLTVGKLGFEAAHNLYNYQGDCSRLHGHSYKLCVTVEGNIDKNGFVLDFGWVKDVVKKNIIDVYDHRYLNDMFDFNPTAENMAVNFAQTLNYVFSQYEGVKLISVKLWETEHNCAEVILN